jgi:hypothetical protein
MLPLARSLSDVSMVLVALRSHAPTFAAAYATPGVHVRKQVSYVRSFCHEVPVKRQHLH